MVFTSPTFLFLFLPIVLAVFAVTPARLRTGMLVAASWLFYAWGEQQLVLLLMLSTIFNWAAGLAIDRAEAPRARRLWLTGAIIVNIGALVYFKYVDFLWLNLNSVRAALGMPIVPWLPTHLPLGISFVTFEAVSYVVDVYRRHTPAVRNPVHVAFYISFFPHLIAGPILRFNDIAAPLARPTVTLEGFDRGIARFIDGLGKKMLIANPLGHVADQVFLLPIGQLSAPTAWLGILAYALQIYFDFSGYSDMAIGLGHMFGFTLPENFRLPYAADSMRDFWRRWHMSLSSWFRDYLFLPMGGSRFGTLTTCRNLVIVFALCGFWHGAGRRFIFWGLFHGAFLSLERTRLGGALARAPLPIRRAYTFGVVVIGWVFFRAENLALAGGYLKAMAGLGHTVSAIPARMYMTPELLFVMGAGFLLSMVSISLRRLPAFVASAIVLAMSLLYVAAGTYNPFIYFRF